MILTEYSRNTQKPPFPEPLRPPQILRALDWNQTWSSVVRVRRLTAWAVIRSSTLRLVIYKASAPTSQRTLSVSILNANRSMPFGAIIVCTARITWKVWIRCVMKKSLFSHCYSKWYIKLPVSFARLKATEPTIGQTRIWHRRLQCAEEASRQVRCQQHTASRFVRHCWVILGFGTGKVY